MNLKRAFKLLGNHDDLERGSIIELTEEESLSKIFTNKLEAVVESGSSKITEEANKMIEEAEKKVSEMIKEAEEKAGQIIIQAKEKASEIIAKANSMLEKTESIEPVKEKKAKSKKESK